jgi:hypothetical protein
MIRLPLDRFWKKQKNNSQSENTRFTKSVKNPKRSTDLLGETSNGKIVYHHNRDKRYRTRSTPKQKLKLSLPKKILPAMVLFLIAIVAFALFAYIRPMSITCITDQGDQCPSELSREIQKSKELPFINSKQQLMQLFDANSSIESYKITSTLVPFGWAITVVLRSPQYALSDISKTSFALVDESGKIIRIQSEPFIPYLVIPTEIPPLYAQLDNQLLFSLTLVKDIYTIYGTTYGTLTYDGLVIEVDAQKRVLFPVEGDRRSLIGGLMYIVERLEMSSFTQFPKFDPSTVREVDMRFINPVLRI